MEEAFRYRQQQRLKKVSAVLAGAMALAGGKIAADAAYEKGRVDAIYARAAKPTHDQQVLLENIKVTKDILSGKKRKPDPACATAELPQLRGTIALSK